MRITMVPHNPKWRQEFQGASEQITAALGDNVMMVHHIGSTAIPGIYAKPIIDMLLVVRSLTALDKRQPLTAALGYEGLGEFGIPGRRYFRRDNAMGERTHQIHAFEPNSPQITRHLAFRDYMLAHPESAEAYSLLKRDLAANYPNDSEAYMDGKDEFIQEIDRRAVQP